jgi:hypothetical protein
VVVHLLKRVEVVLRDLVDLRACRRVRGLVGLVESSAAPPAAEPGAEPAAEATPAPVAEAPASGSMADMPRIIGML